jgi:hypothetical protein
MMIASFPVSSLAYLMVQYDVSRILHGRSMVLLRYLARAMSRAVSAMTTLGKLCQYLRRSVLRHFVKTIPYNILATSNAITLSRFGTVVCTRQTMGSAATESHVSVIMFSTTMIYARAPLAHARGVYNQYRGALPLHWKAAANMTKIA